MAHYVGSVQFKHILF